MAWHPAPYSVEITALKKSRSPNARFQETPANAYGRRTTMPVLMTFGLKLDPK